jgi:glycine cleavage system aminomethyltransferase T
LPLPSTATPVGVAKAGAPIYRKNGDFAGSITSSAFSTKEGRAIAFAHLNLSSLEDPTLVLGPAREEWSI